ncbi:MAG: hypothetical protein ACM3ZV_07580 [Bacillota bacterium]
MTQRMADAKALLISRRRTPRVFFLSRDDFVEFMATNPPRVVVTHYGLPMEVPGFDGIGVRQSESHRPNYRSRLFCCIGTGATVPLE